MDLDSVLRDLEALGTDRTKRSYLSRGVREPVYGVATGAMKPLKKRIGVDQVLANDLWNTGNYDAMYLAGMVADVSAMAEEDFDRWIEDAHSSMLSDLVVAVTLAESDLARPVALRWIRTGDENRASAGWACYEWLLGWRPDAYFDVGSVRELLALAAATIHGAPPRVKRAMNGFIVAVGVSYAPLHDDALGTAEAIGTVQIVTNGEVTSLASAARQIRTAVEKGRIGFKRRAVRC
ncbi:MAG: DNA alkylation repair protein [Coriobacteriia bacterium]